MSGGSFDYAYWPNESRMTTTIGIDPGQRTGIAVWVIGLVVLMVCDRRRERRALYRRRVKRLNP